MIKSLKINNLFGYKDINWENLKDVNVLVGKNGLGKSTILQLIQSTLVQEPINNSLTLCDKVEIIFDDNSNTFALPQKNVDEHQFKTTLQDFLGSEEFENQLVNTILKTKKIPLQEKNKIKEKLIHEIYSKNFKDLNVKQFQFKKNTKKINVELISTINMSANSINKIRTSDGRTANFLDLEIENELNRLFKNKTIENDLDRKLTSSLNNIFQETNKKINIKNGELSIIQNNGQSLKYQNLSSGERQVIYIFLKVINASINNSLILMDEPEISLHLSWQERLISEIRKVNKTSQIIIVTHSPAIIMNGWMDSFIDIKDIIKDIIKEAE